MLIDIAMCEISGLKARLDDVTDELITLKKRLEVAVHERDQARKELECKQSLYLLNLGKRDAEYERDQARKELGKRNEIPR